MNCFELVFWSDNIGNWKDDGILLFVLVKWVMIVLVICGKERYKVGLVEFLIIVFVMYCSILFW